MIVCDEKNIGCSVAVRECTDGSCAEETRGCWVVLAAEGGRADWRLADMNCGGAGGCKEGFQPCGTVSSFEGDELAKLEPFLDGFDCSDLERKLHEGMLGKVVLKHSADESWIDSTRTGVSDDLHNYRGTGAVIRRGEWTTLCRLRLATQTLWFWQQRLLLQRN